LILLFPGAKSPDAKGAGDVLRSFV